MLTFPRPLHRLGDYRRQIGFAHIDVGGHDSVSLVAWRATRYTSRIVKSFRHKGLKNFFQSGSAAGIQPRHAKRLRMQLAALDTAMTIEDMDIPGFKLHPLKGAERSRWSIWVSGNWRITFEFLEGHAHILDYEDYH